MLRTQGYMLIPCNNLPSTIRRNILETVHEWPEIGDRFTGIPSDLSVGLGILSNPSSFHHPVIRSAHKEIYETVKTTLEQLDLDQKYIEQLPDRIMIRSPDKVIKTGNYHRDSSPLAKPGDLILGGWLNLDLYDQPFRFVPESQLPETDIEDKGFKRLANQEVEGAETIQVPPNHILIFNETLIHAISGTNKKQRDLGTPSMRIFCGFRLTNNSEPLDPTTRDILLEQGVPNLKSGQKPQMYSALHWTNHRNLLREMSHNYQWGCKEQRVVKSGPSKRMCHIVVDSPMKSLEEYGFEKFPEYSEEELGRYTPQVLEKTQEYYDNLFGVDSESDQSDDDTPISELIRANKRARIEIIDLTEE